MKAKRIYMLEGYIGKKRCIYIEGYANGKFYVFDNTDEYHPNVILEEVGLREARKYAKMACEVDDDK